MLKNKLCVAVHFVWATWDRQPLITEVIERRLWRYIEAACADDKCEVLAVGGMPNHVHLLVLLSSTITLADLMKHVKGGSSEFVSDKLTPGEWFKWQGSYGTFSVSRPQIDKVIQYIANQKQHHAEAGTLWPDAEEPGEFFPSLSTKVDNGRFAHSVGIYSHALKEVRTMMLQTTDPSGAYLEASALIDWEHPAIAAWDAGGGSEEDTVRRAFHFVRDEIAHSWDIGSRRVTAKASEVLEHGEGICYAKSHLLAALLRRCQIASGLCYQRLTLGDTPDTGYCIHALNTVYLSERQQWIRLDARGNKPGVDAQYSLDAEQLAFPVRPEMGEWDYLVNHATPHPKIAATLTAHDDCRLMYAHHLPTEL